MKFWTFSGLGMAALAAIAPASAADQAPVFKAAPAAVAAPWTGFFIGAHIGAASSRKQFFDNFPFPDLELDADVRLKGWLGGLQAGFNYQMNWLVLGIEGDFSWAKVDKKDFSCFPFGDQVCSAEAEWFATVTGRVGAAFGPALLYFKGGAAWVHETFSNLATCAGSQPIFAGGVFADCGDRYFGRQTRLGWVIGGGIEYALSAHWSMKVEYNHMDFGERSVLLVDDEGDFFTELIKQRVDVIKAGVNYRFPVGAALPTSLPVKALAYADPGPFPADKSGGYVLPFVGSDFSKHSYSGWLGAFLAPYSGLDNSGLRVLIYGDGGTYKYFGDPGETFRGNFVGGTVLVGYGFEGDNYSINLLAGANAEHHTVSPRDPLNSVQGTEAGLKLRTDIWVQPAPQTMAAAEAEYSTAFQTYSAKLKLGYDVTAGKQVFIGPEISVAGNERYDHWRVGAHVTQVKLGRAQLDVSAGYAHDSNVGSGAYGTVELSTKF
jgi:outer membrane immunogenic protein